MADAAPVARARSIASTSYPPKPTDYLLQLDGRQPNKNPERGLPNRPDSKYPGNTYDDNDPIAESNHVRSVFLINSYNRGATGGGVGQSRLQPRRIPRCRRHPQFCR